MPGLPAFCRTRFSAARRFRRSHALSIRPLVPGRSSPLPAGDASTRKRGPCGFTAPTVCALGLSSDFCGMASPRRVGVSPSPSFSPSRLAPLLWPLLTSRSADPHGHRRPFRRKARSPRVRPLAFAARPPDLRRLSLGHESFAVTCPLALLSSASYPVPVRRPAASLPASFTPASRSNALRFASLAVTSSREDFHLQVDAHAGRTCKTPAERIRRGLMVKRSLRSCAASIA